MFFKESHAILVDYKLVTRKLHDGWQEVTELAISATFFVDRLIIDEARATGLSVDDTLQLR